MTAAGRTRWKVAADYTLTGLLGWVSVGPVSIRDLSLKELRALAQLRLGTKAAALKTRQELVDAIEKTEPKKAPRLIVPLAGPLPEPPPVELIELPPEPVIWTGDAPLPQITARPAEPVPVEPGTPSSLDSGRAEPEDPSVPVDEASFTTAIEQPETVTRHFFLEPDAPRLPIAYEDDRVLTFARDPQTIYAAWDFSPARFEEAKARGRVVDAQGATVQSFAVAGPSGGTFVEALPAGVPLQVEVLGGQRVLGQSRWLNLPSDPPVENAPSSVV